MRGYQESARSGSLHTSPLVSVGLHGSEAMTEQKFSAEYEIQFGQSSPVGHRPTAKPLVS